MVFTLALAPPISGVMISLGPNCPPVSRTVARQCAHPRATSSGRHWLEYCNPARALGDANMTKSLCETCKHMREIVTARSRFLLCERSRTEEAYPKYPPQPIVQCPGYEGKEKGQDGDKRCQ